jgi:hypothetical protein
MDPAPEGLLLALDACASGLQLDPENVVLNRYRSQFL